RYADLIAAIDSGDLDTARKIDRSILPAVRGIMTRTQGAIMVKAALQLQGVLDSRMVRMPLLPATEQQVTELRADLVSAELLDGR
ncbi:MAG: dihydrodipicolinate synthase family protein, partial [Nocardioidaceae bacterium]